MPMPKCKQREAAKAAGASTYFTGKPCKYGHVVHRNTADSSCTECRRQFKQKYRRQARKYARRRRQEALSRDPEGTRRAWREANARRRKQNPEIYRASERKKSLRFRTWHPRAKLADTRRRQTAQMQRTPLWADHEAIRQIYLKCPPGHDVDHIVPLRGRRVSGLHVPENLQYLPAKENRTKGVSYHVS